MNIKIFLNWPRKILVSSKTLIMVAFLTTDPSIDQEWKNIQEMWSLLVEKNSAKSTPRIIREKVFKSVLSTFCGRQPKADHISWHFLKTVFHKIYLVHSWIFCPICRLEKYKIKLQESWTIWTSSILDNNYINKTQVQHVFAVLSEN